MSRFTELIFTALLAVASVWHFGCAVTDYGITTDLGPVTPLNHSHGLIDCLTDDRFASSQQTFELQTRELFYTREPSRPGACLPPALLADHVSRSDAREWNRFLAAFSFQAEFRVTGSSYGNGTYLAAGVKDLSDGSWRINNLWYPLTADTRGPWSCTSSRVGGREGGPEGLVIGDGWTQPGATAPRLPGLRPDTIAIDSEPGFQGCSNIVAAHPDSRMDLPPGFFSVFARRGEWRLQATPITKRGAANMARLLFGGDVTVDWEGIAVTVRAEIQLDGDIGVELLSLSSAEASYEAKKPLRFALDPSSGFRRVALDLSGRGDELRRLAGFALSAGLADREIELGQFIPELGVQLPDVSVLISGSGLEGIAKGELLRVEP